MRDFFTFSTRLKIPIYIEKENPVFQTRSSPEKRMKNTRSNVEKRKAPRPVFGERTGEKRYAFLPFFGWESADFHSKRALLKRDHKSLKEVKMMRAAMIQGPEKRYGKKIYNCKSDKISQVM